MRALVFTFLILSTSTQAGWEAFKRYEAIGDGYGQYRELVPMAEAGDVEAQHKLATMLYEGNGILPNKRKAFEWFRTMANNGDARYQYRMGNLYYFGEGLVQPDYTIAFQWFQEAAHNGHLGAKSQLASMYRFGTGVPQDLVQALKLFEEVADHKNLPAVLNVAHMHYKGEGTKQDYTKAMALYQLASEYGEYIAHDYLAHMYRNGEGVEKNIPLAYVHANLSAVLANKYVAPERDELRDMLSAEDFQYCERISRHKWDQIVKNVGHAPPLH